MTRPLIILGTGGSAHDVLDTVEAINAAAPTWEVAGFLDDARPAASEHLGLPVLGGLRVAGHFAHCAFVNAIGSDASYRKRPEIIASTGLSSEHFATLVHPGALVSARARLGRGVCVHFGVSVGGGATIGNHAALHPGSIVGHDTILEDFAIVAPGAVISGFVHVGRACYIGSRAVIRQRLRIGDGALVGMGAVVVRAVDAGTTVIGCPAKPAVLPVPVGEPSLADSPLGLSRCAGERGQRRGQLPHESHA